MTSLQGYDILYINGTCKGERVQYNKNCLRIYIYKSLCDY